MISEVISALNEYLTFPEGSKIYGLAQSVVREKSEGRELLPCIVDNNGEGKDVSIDNTLPIIIYHKSNSIQVRKGNKGMGDAGADTINTYSNVMIVYLDRKKTGLTPDDILLQIQIKK